MTTFTILAVCTGNVCRSPLAEQLLQIELHDLPGVRIRSAGMHALDGAPMTPEAKQLARRLGVSNPDDHVARQLREADVREADLVLAMSREHRRAAVELVPRAARKTFTVREFARLSGAVADGVFEAHTPLLTKSAAERLCDGVEVVASMRGSLPPLADPLDDDVVDPYRQSQAVYDESASQLVPAVRSTADLLRRAAFGAI